MFHHLDKLLDRILKHIPTAEDQLFLVVISGLLNRNEYSSVEDLVEQATVLCEQIQQEKM